MLLFLQRLSPFKFLADASGVNIAPFHAVYTLSQVVEYFPEGSSVFVAPLDCAMAFDS